MGWKYFLLFKNNQFNSLDINEYLYIFNMFDKKLIFMLLL